MDTLKRMILALPALTLILSLGIGSSATAQSFPETIPLPPGFQPEGITLGNGPTAYVGSLFDGSIYEVDLRTGAGSELELVQGPFMAVGLDFDRRSGYLFVAGGLSGYGFVYDTDTGGSIDVPIWLGEGWINDVIVTQDAAYFTNSFAPHIYKVPLTAQGAPSGVAELLELGGEWVNIPQPESGTPVINANGIVATPDGGTLIVVNYALGQLYTVDPETGFATKIDLGGNEVPFGDGLVLRGKTLYVVQNFPGQITVFTLSSDLSKATRTQVLTDGDFRVPSTADLFGPWLYAVNARFDICFPGLCDPTGLDFDIVRIDQ